MTNGANLCHGILAALFDRNRTGQGSLVQTRLLESIDDFQFEVLTTYLNHGQRPPRQLVYQRDDNKRILADIFKEAAKQHWLGFLAYSDFWCAGVLDWDELTRSPTFAQLGMTQDATSRARTPVRLMRAPVQINGVGEHLERLHRQSVNTPKTSAISLH